PDGTGRLAADERHEVTRLCEGVVRLEQLLQTVRQTVDRAPSAAPDAHVADVVERSIAPAHVQWPLHADMSDDSSTPSWSKSNLLSVSLPLRELARPRLALTRNLRAFPAPSPRRKAP